MPKKRRLTAKQRKIAREWLALQQMTTTERMKHEGRQPLKSGLRGGRTRESDIVHETPVCWVKRDRGSYTVFRTGVTHSTSDSAYRKNADGLSIAVARCKYLEKRKGSK